MEEALIGFVGALVGAVAALGGSALSEVRQDRRDRLAWQRARFGDVLANLFWVRSAVVSRDRPDADTPDSDSYRVEVRKAYDGLLQAYARAVLVSGGSSTTAALEALREAAGSLVERCLEDGYFASVSGQPSGLTEFVTLRDVQLATTAELQRRCGYPVAPAR